MSEAMKPGVSLVSSVTAGPWAAARQAVQVLAASLWANQPLWAGVWATLSCYAVLQVLFCVHVHVSFEGQYAGPFLISKAFGVPTREAANGVRPVEPVPGGPYGGWDSQFYYHVSNDLWMTRDAKKHIDNPSYRYQRVGMPLLAHAASKLLGFRITSPFVYHAVQLLLTAVGFGGLVFWLTAHGLPRFYALTWLLSPGTFLTLRFGMPDAACDGLLILAVLGAYYRRLAVYVPAVTLMCLGRETYIVFPFLIGVLTLVNRFQWPGVRRYWVRLGLVAVPGAVVLAWAVFVSHRLQLPFLYGARAVPSGFLTDYPFLAGARAVWRTWQSVELAEAKYTLAAFCTLAIIMLVGLRHAWKSSTLFCLLPLLVLLTMAGSIVWSVYVMGSSKNVLPAVACGVLMLPWSRGLLLQGVLLFQIAVGLDVFFTECVWRSPQFSADHAAVSIHGSLFETVQKIPGPRVTDYRMKITAAVASTQEDPPYHGPWRWCHRESMKVKVKVENTSGQVWNREPTNGNHVLQFGFFLRGDAGKDVLVYTYALPRDVAPGESYEQVLPLPYLRLDGKFTLQFSMVQHNDCWFFQREANSQFTLPIEVHSVLR